MDSVILDQLNNLEKYVNSEVIKTSKGRRKKTDTKMLPIVNEGEENDIRDKREKLTACILSGNSKQYLGKEYKLMKWTSVILIYCQIDTNPF